MTQFIGRPLMLTVMFMIYIQKNDILLSELDFSLTINIYIYETIYAFSSGTLCPCYGHIPNTYCVMYGNLMKKFSFILLSLINCIVPRTIFIIYTINVQIYSVFLLPFYIISMRI